MKTSLHRHIKSEHVQEEDIKIEYVDDDEVVVLGESRANEVSQAEKWQEENSLHFDVKNIYANRQDHKYQEYESAVLIFLWCSIPLLRDLYSRGFILRKKQPLQMLLEHELWARTLLTYGSHRVTRRIKSFGRGRHMKYSVVSWKMDRTLNQESTTQLAIISLRHLQARPLYPTRSRSGSCPPYCDALIWYLSGLFRQQKQLRRNRRLLIRCLFGLSSKI